MTQTRSPYLRQSIFQFVITLAAVATTVSAQTDVGVDSATVEITSKPVGGLIFLNGKDLGLVTPASLVVSDGEHLIEIIIEDYEPLAKRLPFEAGKLTRMEFVLESLPPPPTTAASLGLVLRPKIALLREERATLLEDKWSGLAETFAIVPLGQGIIARLVLPKEHHSAANTMVLTGLGLTVGSYIVGKVLGKRKLRQIRARNEEIPSLNEEIRAHNEEISRTVMTSNTQTVREWMAGNKTRGVVNVSVE
jgi:hypothetical protein